MSLLNLLSALNKADDKWMPIQKAHELLDSVNEDNVWEERRNAGGAVFDYVADLFKELEKAKAERDDARAMVEQLIEAGEAIRCSRWQCRLDSPAPLDTWDALAAEWQELNGKAPSRTKLRDVRPDEEEWKEREE
jgi:hypothetical protein